MATIIAEATDTAVEVTFTISNASGAVTGLTVAASCYDRAREAGDGNIWLQGAGPTWSTGKVTAALTEVGGGLYAGSLNVSSATGRNLIVLYDYSGTETGVESDQLILLDALANASAAALATVDSNVDAVLVDTGTTLPATLSTIDGKADTIISTGSTGPWTQGAGGDPSAIADAVWDEAQTGHLTVGSFGYYLDAQVSVAGGSGLDAAGVRSAIGLAAADLDTQLDAIVEDTGTDIPARFDGIEGAGFVTGTDSLEAIRDRGDAAWTGGGLDAAQTRAALGMAAANLDTQIGTLATEAKQDIIDTNVDAIITTGSTGPWTQGGGLDAPGVRTAIGLAAANLDTQLGTLAVPGDEMLLATAAETQLVDAVWDEANAGHVAVGSMGYNQDQAASGGAGVTPTQIAEAVWDADETLYDDANSMGELLHGAGGGSSPGAVASAVWSAVQSGYSTPGQFGYLLDEQVSNAGDPATIAAEVDTVLGGSHGAGSWEGDDAATVAAAITADHGAGSYQTATGFAVAGDQMALDAAAEAQLVDALWDEANADHVTAGTVGFNQDQAAAGGAGVTPLQIENAVWNSDQADHVAVGSMGKAVADSADVPDNIAATANRMYQAVRRYGPVLVQQPLAGKDEVHAGDLEIVLTIPVILDGNYSDLSDATSIALLFREPGADESTFTSKTGIGVTTQTGSYTSWTTDNTVFQTTGRWRVSALVTWPDATTKASDSYVIDVQSPLPLV